jgi:nucleotide-binding universal stress UspA family protein
VKFIFNIHDEDHTLKERRSFFLSQFLFNFIHQLPNLIFMRTIIAPTDFSAVSLNAVNYAADLAVAINAELILLTVIQIPLSVGEAPLPEIEYEEMIIESKQELRSLVNKLFLRTKHKINIHSKLAAGSVAHELKEICFIKKPFAVVMGTRGVNAVERFFLGSNSLFAANNLKYPVLIVPQNASFTGIKSIALASDLKRIESKPVEVLKEWLNIFESKLDVVNVTEDTEPGSTAVFASISIENLLPEYNPQFFFITKDEVEEGVDQFIEENKPDLLVVIPKNYDLLSGIFHKSKSKPFILHPHIPVLAIAE